MITFFTFWAGFFRTNHEESSTRLAGLACFFVALFLSVYMVVKGHTDANSQVVLGQCFTFGAIALGLRKSPDTKAVLVDPDRPGQATAIVSDSKVEVIDASAPGVPQPPKVGG